ncbi:hypothetical protein FQN54_004769 [Arachnomyces sp. PD_36]|nr:hypothetical protein FQN54_004769 [Arachnomyces sp. PD_36]
MTSEGAPTTEPTTTSRRCHTKSRNGCSQCKKRKVKCDEQAPCCRNCKKRGVRCDFETSWPNSEPPASSKSKEDSPIQSISSTTSDEAQELAPSYGALSIRNNMTHVACNGSQNISLRELELMHHYTSTVFLSLAADHKAYRPVWQVAVPREAQSYQFLMHAILAISSLHLSHQWSSNERNNAQAYKKIALTHCNSALNTFRSTVTTITPSNIHAFFAFSHIMVFFSFGSSKQSSRDRKMDDAIGDLLDVFNLLRGSMKIIYESWDVVSGGSLGVLLERGPPIMDRKYLPADAAEALKYLEALCEVSFVEDEKRKKVHEFAIQQLYDSFVMAEMKYGDWGMVLRFPLILPETLLACLRLREPMSLVILAHYCIILYRAPTRWWKADWSARVIEAVYRSLDENWRHAIYWPLEVIGGGRRLSVQAEE